MHYDLINYGFVKPILLFLYAISRIDQLPESRMHYKLK